MPSIPSSEALTRAESMLPLFSSSCRISSDALLKKTECGSSCFPTLEFGLYGGVMRLHGGRPIMLEFRSQLKLSEKRVAALKSLVFEYQVPTAIAGCLGTRKIIPLEAFLEIALRKTHQGLLNLVKRPYIRHDNATTCDVISSLEVVGRSKPKKLVNYGVKLLDTSRNHHLRTERLNPFYDLKSTIQRLSMNLTPIVHNPASVGLLFRRRSRGDKRCPGSFDLFLRMLRKHHRNTGFWQEEDP